jgi:uncharacterized protein YciI
VTVYAVRYTYDRRTGLQDEVRPEHRAYLRSLADSGSLLGSGPFASGDPGALLIFRADSREALDALLAADPFAGIGVIAATEVRPWALVLGPWAASAG